MSKARNVAARGPVCHTFSVAITRAFLIGAAAALLLAAALPLAAGGAGAFEDRCTRAPDAGPGADPATPDAGCGQDDGMFSTLPDIRYRSGGWPPPPPAGDNGAAPAGPGIFYLPPDDAGLPGAR